MDNNHDQNQPFTATQWRQNLYNRFPDSHPVKLALNRVAIWFNSLPSLGKVVVVIVGLSASMSLLSSVLQLVASLISLAILGIILYGVYKFFVMPQSPN